MVHQLIRERGSEFEAINIPFKSYFCGQWMKHCGWWPGYTSPRVLKRGYFEFSRTLHGGVQLNGREIRLPPDAQTGIEHYSFRDLSHYVEKFNRYTSTEALQLAEREITYDWRGAVRFMAHDLWEHYELHNARLDGERGWILTWMAGQYRWMSVAKLIDHGKSSEQQGGPSSVPRDLDEFTKALEEELASFRTQTPELPFGVVWRGPVWDTTSGAAEFRCCVMELAQGTRAVTLESLSESQTQHDAIPKTDRTMLRALERSRRARHVVTVTQWGSIIVPPDRCACHNVLRIRADAAVSVELMAQVNAYDEVLAESAEQVRFLCSLGAAPERLRVVASLGSVKTASDDGHTSVLENELRRIEGPFCKPSLPTPDANQIRVVLEGEFFAGHSFSNINEQLAIRLARESSLALTLQRMRHQPTNDTRSLFARQFAPYLGSSWEGRPEVIVRHAFPANWHKPPTGRWVHIQPWEFGSLPNDWLPHLRDEVDEIWVMSKYVENVYRVSGVAQEKLHYIPWGIDPDVFRPETPPRLLPTAKAFRFLYVGGTILRKGFDRVLAAYLTEFTSLDDVCLVVKDVGMDSFYGPQSMRKQIVEAIKKPGNPAIVYLEEEMTAGQLASLYTACHCLVAPYRGEGFGLPVLEALACGVPPIVPLGGPTDDFVDTDSGFLLPSLVVPAEGVANLCGPATELHVSLDDVRRAMRWAYSDQDDGKRLGLQGSQRVRREFTWASTAAKIVQRLHAIADAQPVVFSTGGVPTDEPETMVTKSESPLGAVIGDVSHVGELIDSLARIRPFVASIVAIYDGDDSRVPQVASEYGASVAKEGSPLGLQSCDWVLFLDAGEYMPEDDLEAMKVWLQDLPANIDRVGLNYLEPSAGAASESLSAIRLVRWDDALAARCLVEVTSSPAGAENNAAATIAPFHMKRVPAVCSVNQGLPISPPSGSHSISLGTGDNTTSAGPGAKDQRSIVASPKYGRLGKSVLIQMAIGPHEKLLELTREHHRRYAGSHGMDYWCIAGNPVRGKRAGWGKVPLLLSGIELGYETVIWLDSDAVIVRPEVDLTRLVEHGIGMVCHPQPQHWNTGFIVVRSSAETLQFWREVDAAPENDSAWMEQYAANALASRPEFARILRPLNLRYNSVPGYAMADSPVIVAAHGLPMEQRATILKDALATVVSSHHSIPIPAAPPPIRREDFGRFLNESRLIGEAAEIGVLRGEYARALLDRWRGRLLHLVDPWQHQSDYHDIANLSNEEFERCLEATRRNLAPHTGRFRIHRLTSAEAAGNFADASLDFVYLDANHHFDVVSEDLQLWFPKLRPGGILAGHDFLDGELPEGSFGVASAVRCFLQDVGADLHLTQEAAWPSWYFFKPMQSPLAKVFRSSGSH